jgi:hypothetical protein
MLCEVCNKFEARHKHHIISKSLGGSDLPNNICKICPNCHDNTHRGKIIIEGRFLTTNGFKLIWHNKNESSITNMEDSRVHIF